MLAACMALIDESSDKELFKKIYRTNKKIAFKSAFAVLKNHALTDEAMQETWLAVAKDIMKFRDADSNYTAALITIIARNKAITLQRKEHKESAGSNYINVNKTADSIVLDEITIKENYDAVLSAIKSLNSIYSDVLLLKYVYGYDVKSISTMFDSPEKTIESRLYRGRKLLAEKMEELYGL